MKIIVGLGNPGQEYDGTRHNVGWMVVNELARRLQIPLTTEKFQSLFGSGRVGDETVALMKPLTYMNNSGSAVQAATSFYNCPCENFLVICDDINLPLGKLRLRRSGSSGGHRGLASIEEMLASDAYPRLRIGVGRGLMEDQRTHVLSRFTREEQDVMAASLQRAADAVQRWLSGSMDDCMNEFNA